MGTGKSSLIGSLYRACNKSDVFPERIHKSLHNQDSHGTKHWLETPGNSTGTIVYQDTRGDTVSYTVYIIIICIECVGI